MKTLYILLLCAAPLSYFLSYELAWLAVPEVCSDVQKLDWFMYREAFQSAGFMFYVLAVCKFNRENKAVRVFNSVVIGMLLDDLYSRLILHDTSFHWINLFIIILPLLTDFVLFTEKYRGKK